MRLQIPEYNEEMGGWIRTSSGCFILFCHWKRCQEDETHIVVESNTRQREQVPLVQWTLSPCLTNSSGSAFKGKL